MLIIKKYFINVIKEAKRVKWPKITILYYSVVVVFVISLIFAFFLSIEDLAAGIIFKQLKKIFITILDK